MEPRLPAARGVRRRAVALRPSGGAARVRPRARDADDGHLEWDAPFPGRWEPLAELVDVLAISIDGTPAEHDEIRRRDGALARTIANLDTVRASGVPFGFVFTLTQYNVDSLEFVVRLAAAEGARSVQVHPLRLSGRAAALMNGARPDEIELVAARVQGSDARGRSRRRRARRRDHRRPAARPSLCARARAARRGARRCRSRADCRCGRERDPADPRRQFLASPRIAPRDATPRAGRRRGLPVVLPTPSPRRVHKRGMS